MKKKKIAFNLFAMFAILIGLYPLLYFIADMSSGLLSSKDPMLLKQGAWSISFYTHIALGGLALAIGWSQFNRRLRRKNVKLHRDIGKVYMICAFLSGTASLYLAYHATGGLIASLGFGSLGVIWLWTTLFAFLEIKNGKISNHQKYMFYSYGACFAAVTLRIWLPTLIAVTDNFNLAYQITSWLCWVPNIIVAHILVTRVQTKRKLSKAKKYSKA